MLLRSLISLCLILPAFAADEWAPARLSPTLQQAIDQSPHQVLDLIVVLKSQPAAEAVAEQNAAFTFERESLERSLHDLRQRGLAAADSPEAAAVHDAFDALTLRIRRATAARLATLTQPHYDQASAAAQALGATVLERYTALNALHLRIPAHAIPSLLSQPAVAEVFPNSAQSAQLDMSVPQLGAPNLWNLGYRGAGQRVAIFDTGVNITHPALSPASWTRKVFLSGNSACTERDSPTSVEDFHGHGTHIAGIVLSRGGSSGLDASRLGVAPQLSSPYSYKIACRDNTNAASTVDSDVLAALDDLVANTPVRIVNFSFGATTAEDYPSSARMWDYFADTYGLAVSFPSGNKDSNANDCYVHSPAVAFNAVAVGNALARDMIYPSSCIGPTVGGRRKPDLAAPGYSIDSTSRLWDSGPAFVNWTGTSMASAHIAGSFALLAQAGITSPLAARAILLSSADNRGNSFTYDFGYGHADLQRASSQLNVQTNAVYWPDSTHATAAFYRGSFSGTASAALTWNRHLTRPAAGTFTESSLARLELYAYTPANALIGAGTGADIDNVRRLLTSATGSTVVTVTSPAAAPRPPENFALASSVPLTPLTGPVLGVTCWRPAAILPGASFSFSCGVSNNGDIDAHAVTVSAQWPDGFSGGASSMDYGSLSAGSLASGKSWGTVTAPSTPGFYTLRFLIQSSSYGALIQVSNTYQFNIGPVETSPVPTITALPSSARPNSPVDAAASAGLTDLGHTVEYQFDWGDGTLSPWGAPSQFHSYAAAGTYSVSARTRCATHTTIVSASTTPRSIAIASVGVPRIPNPGFSSGSIDPWVQYGAIGANIVSYESDYRLQTYGGAGGLYLDLQGLTPQSFYHITVRVMNLGGPGEVMLWAHDGLGSDGVWSGWRNLAANRWEQLQINFRATQSGMARLHLETRGPLTNHLWDDVQVTPGWISDMENGTVSPWIPFGAVTAAPASSPANGLYSLALTGSGGAFYDAVGLVPGRWYHVKARVRAAAATAVRLWLHDTQGANSLADGWYNLAPGVWTELQLNYQANAMAAMRIHIQANTAGVVTYWDDVQVLDGWRSDFDGQSGAAGWTMSGSISTTTCPSPLGLSCLTQTGAAGEHYREFSGLRPSHLYRVRVKLRIESGGSPNAQFSVRDSSNYHLHDTPWYSSPLPWSTKQYSFPAPSDGIIRVYLSKGGPDGAVSWDEVELLDGWIADFEDGSLAHWTLYRGGGHSVVTSPDGTNKALESAAQSYQWASLYAISPLLPLNPGLIPRQFYHASARVRLQYPAAVPVAAFSVGGASDFFSNTSTATPRSDQWTTLDTNFQVGLDGYMTIALWSQLTPWLLWDDVQVKEGWVSGFESLGMAPWTSFGNTTSLPASSPAIGGGSLAQSGGSGGVYLDVPSLTAGRRYQISARARSSAGATAQASLWVHDTAGANASFAVARTPSPYVWDRFTLNFTATVTGKVRIHLTTNGDAGEIYWDEVRLSEGWTSDFDNGMIYGWNSYGATSQALSAAAAIGPISLAQSGGNGGSWQDVKDLIPGQDYLIVARSRSSLGASNQSILWVHDTTGANQIWSVGSTPSPYGWDERRLFYRANSTGAVRLHLANTGGTGTLYWDDIEVVPVH